MEVELLRKAMEKIPSRYELAVVAAERCKQLMNGARPLVEPRGDHPRKIALREIAEGKLIKIDDQYLPAETPESPSQGVEPVQEDDESASDE